VSSSGGKNGQGRARADETLALALARGLTLAAAAAEAHVSERTAQRRAADREFADRVVELRARLVETALGQLADGMAEAASTLRALLRADSESVRLGAARVLLEMALKVRDQTETESRLAALEQRFAGQDKARGPGL